MKITPCALVALLIITTAYSMEKEIESAHEEWVKCYSSSYTNCGWQQTTRLEKYFNCTPSSELTNVNFSDTVLMSRDGSEFLRRWNLKRSFANSSEIECKHIDRKITFKDLIKMLNAICDQHPTGIYNAQERHIIIYEAVKEFLRDHYKDEIDTW
jgi:hypothetical protein